MLLSRKSLNQKGFSMVELLVVIAIIGVLAGVGVPSYRRMIQKSRKTEAQVLLGGIATVEAAFFSEYGVYGNNLTQMGMDTGISAQTYGAGFPASAAGIDLVAAATAATAAAVTTPSTSGNLAAPTNYTAFNAAGPSVLGYSGNSSYVVSLGYLTALPAATANKQAYLSYVGTTHGYRAVAYGSVDGTANTRACTATANASEDCDVWTIDQGRTLVNADDGIQ